LETTAPAAAAPPERIPPKPWGIPGILLALALPVLLWGSSFGVAIAQGTPDELSEGEIALGLIFTIILDFVFIGLAAGLSLWRYRMGWGALGLRRFDGGFWWLPLAAAAGAHAGIIAYTFILLLVGGEGATPEQDLEDLFESRAILPLTGVATVIMAPLAEEIFFRGFIFAGLIRPLGPRAAMVLSGFLFGAFHITGPESVGLVVPFGVVGILFAWVYYRTGSLWPSIATHFLFNLVSFVILASVVGSG
jgi:membrane protease YdiL (CAAX protease family)